MTDRAAFRPYRTGVALLRGGARAGAGGFRWRTEPYEFVADPPAIDLLTGSDAVRTAIDAGASLDDLVAGFVAVRARIRRAAAPPVPAVRVER